MSSNTKCDETGQELGKKCYVINLIVRSDRPTAESDKDAKVAREHLDPILEQLVASGEIKLEKHGSHFYGGDEGVNIIAYSINEGQLLPSGKYNTNYVMEKVIPSEVLERVLPKSTALLRQNPIFVYVPDDDIGYCDAPWADEIYERETSK